ncbi:ubiquitin-like protein 4A [Cephus cinctus]|uniref:Ubiquitin-like protein 4A n=1 Tax=Cephus cinctus TaxID=211228 RepID=A0AAJ7RTM3_CEPCN|nr:ubiquitin-like protein 4A [Cephus cinctus]XP_024946901.1 ubiquitin-like protein 4A [Cephus cinctus]
MKVIVKILQGKECVVEIMPSETVLELKHKVSSLLGIDVPQQKLLLTGKALADENPLSFYPGIKDGSKLNLVVKKAVGESNEGKSSHNQSSTQLLRVEMSRVLRHYYTESETESIVNELIKDLKNKVNNLSFDDLERLATALLQDQETIA